MALALSLLLKGAAMSEVDKDDVIERMAERIVRLENDNALLSAAHVVLRDRIQEIQRQCAEVLNITGQVKVKP